MGYYIRVLTPEPTPVSPVLLQKAAEAHRATVAGDLGASAWEQLVVVNEAGEKVCAVERNLVFRGSLAEEEIEEFLAEIADCLPNSGGSWLRTYLATVRTIYAFQVLHGAYSRNGWEILGFVKEAVRSSVGGIMQADNEGFSNEEGYHILWQFSDGARGDWWMAVLKDGLWQKFKMDLGNEMHRLAFKNGEIPEGTERQN
jgi:hypothetical protein